jgi:CVNH domain
MQGDTLFSSCKDRNGNFQDTQLANVTQCVGDIFNDNGTLQCNRGAPPPNGSYRQSCENSHMQGGTLLSTCRDRGGALHQTQLADVNHCVGDIFNDNGTLQCSRGAPPPGTYTRSCSEISVNNGTLHANCRDSAGGVHPTQLANFARCVGDISNFDGELTCAMGQGPLPPGSYIATCKEVTFTPTEITHAACRTISGSFRVGSLILQGCLTPVVNQDGFLDCDCDKGGAAAPPGSYRRTCHGIRMNGSTLSAQCRRTDGSYTASSLEHEQLPQRDHKSRGLAYLRAAAAPSLCTDIDRRRTPIY